MTSDAAELPTVGDVLSPGEGDRLLVRPVVLSTTNARRTTGLSMSAHAFCPDPQNSGI